MYYRITATAKHGGIWDGTRAVREFVTEDGDAAQALEAAGCRVERCATQLEQMNVAQLKKYAKDNAVDVCGASTKAAILTAILSAIAATDKE